MLLLLSNKIVIAQKNVHNNLPNLPSIHANKMQVSKDRLKFRFINSIQYYYKKDKEDARGNCLIFSLVPHKLYIQVTS